MAESPRRQNRLDLHLHTTFSDGSLPPKEVLKLADQAGVRALSITDHDTVEGIPEALEAGTRLGIEVIPGIEISSRWRDSELHILGYFLNWRDPQLHERLARLRATRHDRNPQIVERLNKLGLSLSYDEVKAVAGSDSVGRPHIARVLMDKHYVTSAKEAFDRYLAEGAAAYVPRSLPGPEEAIRWIRDAGGIAVLAHPVWIKQPGEAHETLCRQLQDQGLQGLEVFYSTHKARQTSLFLDIARRLGLLVTGGSDFHGLTKPDIEVGIGRGELKVPGALLEPLKKAAIAPR